MRRLWNGPILWVGLLVGGGLGAAPAPSSYQGVDWTIDEVRRAWAQPSARPQPNAPGWNAFFDALRGEFRTYATAPDDNSRLVSLNRLHQMSVALRGVPWGPANAVREELRVWLRPRVRLAWAERRLLQAVGGLRTTTDPTIRGNRERWVTFVDQDLGAALKQYEAATTVQQRRAGLKGVQAALGALQASNRSRPWVPSLELQSALDDLFNLPNFDVSADVASLSPVLNANLIQSGPIYRNGYVSQVTAGPKTGFGLLPSDDGIAFYNKQLLTSVTPIHDFQNQVSSDRKGRRAAKLYYFNATSMDQSELTVIGVLRSTGLQLLPASSHSVGAAINSLPIRGKGFGRFIAAIIGLNQRKITQKVYEGAIGKIQQNVVQEATEMSHERTSQEAAQRNMQFARYLLGNNTVAINNILIDSLDIRSRPENALIGGRVHLMGTPPIGADTPQPSRFAIPAPGVSADVHLGSILSTAAAGFLQSPRALPTKNLLIVTRDVPPNAPPGEAVQVTTNADYAGFLKAVEQARAANNPKVTALRIKRPERAPEFASDARGYLVALVSDFQLDVPAPPQAARGGLAGPRARVYRISSPQAEFTVSFNVVPPSYGRQGRLTGRIEGFDAGPGAKVFALNEDENKPVPLPAFTSTIALGVLRNKIQGQPIDVPLNDPNLRGFAINQVSPLDPSGWMRVVLTPTR